ncbi:MAG TPA: CotH kinase family protein [Flavobacterium sp.]|jgi:hypothetical protein
MKSKLLSFCLFIAASLNAQSFYDTETIQEIRIYFSQPDWEMLLNNEQLSTQNYIPAESVVINGTTFNNVGVKYKGNSSFEPFLIKNPFHIELDAFQNQDYQGYTDIKLSNVAFDPSFIRETLSYKILRQYMAAPQSNYANVYVNDMLIGLYVNTESVSKKFVRTHFHSDNNAFFDCSPVNGAGGGGTLMDLPALIYWGPDQGSYSQAYRMKSETGWDELIALIETLENNPATIETVLDVDRTLWMLAFDNVMVNLDSYIGTFNQNYYLYKDDNGRFNPVLWDLNMSFGVFADLGSSFLETTEEKKQLSPLVHTTDPTFPLVFKLLNIPRYKKIYLAHYNTIMQENFVNNSYLPKAQAMKTLIDASVQADENKLNSYPAFQTNLNNDVMTNNGLIAPGITNLANGRTSFLSGLTEFSSAKPVISNVTPLNTSPPLGTSVTITASVINTNANAVFLGFRNDLKDIFTKVAMFDDGTHGDGGDGDNVYGASVTITNTYMQYYIYAENNVIGAFSPARAEYEFHTINATYPTLDEGDLKINELMAQNTGVLTDPAGQFEDWIELYNNTENTISLDNLYMSDNPENLQKWQFPDGLTIAPHGYLIVWADEELEEEGVHADLKLSASGESVILSYPNGNIVDSVTFGAQAANTSYARIPNGTGPFMSQLHTFNANNETLATGDFDETFRIAAYPNPFSNTLNLTAPDNILTVEIYNLLGQKIMHAEFDTDAVTIPTGHLETGVYLVKASGTRGTTTLKIVKQ